MTGHHRAPVYLVVGATGQVGFELLRALQAQGTVRAATRADWDLAVPGTASRMLHETAPTVVVNAAAYTGVDAAESDRAACERLNHGWVAELGAACRATGAALVHYSTDYVFDGMSSEPYTEDDATAPLGVYGATKLAGERAALEAGIPALVFRIAWVYGLRGKNFFRTVTRLLSADAGTPQPIRIVGDQVGAPTWARAIAEGTAQALAAARTLGAGNMREGMEKVHGLYHMGSAGSTSWFEFAQVIADARAALGLGPATDIERITSEEYPTPARRPANSRLASDKLARWSGVVLPDWRQQLDLVMADSAAARGGTAARPDAATARNR